MENRPKKLSAIFTEDSVTRAIYFIGYKDPTYTYLYDEITAAGFSIYFKNHVKEMQGSKKGNIDSDLIFMVMEMLYRKEPFNKVILVSGDGDYSNLIDFLIKENKLKIILFPDGKKASSLYKRLNYWFLDSLDSLDVLRKIEMKKPRRQRRQGHFS